MTTFLSDVSNGYATIALFEYSMIKNRLNRFARVTRENFCLGNR